MKHFAIALLFAVSAVFAVRAADGDLFPYPVPPSDMERLDERCDYLVTHFWDRCDFKSALSKTQKLNNTFGDWIGFMPYASAETVHASIDALLEKVKKSAPQTLELARMAQNWVYSDTSEIFSEEIFYPFAKAAAGQRKIAAADRAKFERFVSVIDNTRQGSQMTHLDFVRPDGTAGSLADFHTQVIVVIIGKLADSDSRLDRVMLSADINANALIRANLLTVMYIEPGEASDEWRTEAQSLPSEWVVGAMRDAENYFSLRSNIDIYLLDARHKVLAKDFNIDGLINALASVRINSGI